MSIVRVLLAVAGCGSIMLLHGCDTQGNPPSPVPGPPSQTATCTATSTSAEVVRGYNLSGRVAIVTGGDGGLGHIVVKTLAEKGATVIIASRNLTKCEGIAREIEGATGSHVRGMELDLSSFVSVRQFANDFMRNFSRLDMLINNAGIAGNSQHKSKDGFQLLFAINYLGPFLLTELLLPTLRSSGSASSPSRIVNVASSEYAIACEAAGWKQGCFKDFNHFPPAVLPDTNVTIHYNDGLNVIRSVELYGFTKLLVIQHALELSRREEASVRAFSLTPGWVNDTLGNPKEGLNPVQVIEKCNEQRYGTPPNPCPFSADEGAAIILFCSVQSDLSSGYYSRIKNCKEEVVVNKGSGFEDSMGAELYKRSLRLVGMYEGSTHLIV